MDYQRIREKWDAVKDSLPMYQMCEGFLRELAATRVKGGDIASVTDEDIEALIDETRTRSMIAQAEARGERLAASAAAARAVQARLKAMEPAERQKQADTDEEEQRMLQASVDRFFANYGKTIKAEDIPKEVWDDAAKIGDLSAAYQRWNNTKLEAENKRLKEELEQAKQQQKNRERSMGSSKSVGSAAAKDSFMEGWDDL